MTTDRLTPPSDAPAPAGPRAALAPVRPSADPTDRYRIETRAGQLDEVLELTPYVALTHIAVAAAVLAFFWDVASHAYLIGLFGFVTALVSLCWLGASRFRKRIDSVAAIDLGSRIAAVAALLLGLAWLTMPVTLFEPSDPDHRMLVVAICSGLVASAFTLGPIRALSVLFTTPVVAGSFLALAMSGQRVAQILAVLLTVYAAYALFSVGRITRLSTQRIRDRARLSEQKETISLLLHEFEESTSDWLWEIDADGRLEHVSERVAEVAGRPVEDLARAPFASLLTGAAGLRGDGVSALLASIDGRAAFRNHLVEIAGPGASRWWRLSGKPIYDAADAFSGFRGVGSDITATREAEARIAYLASYDSLTGLANRSLFHDLTSAECARATRLGRSCALLYLDLDGFKTVNDTFGHGFGDALLRRVASRLRSAAADGALVSRLGGDEFAILHPCADAGEAAARARAIIDALSAPYAIDGVQVEIGASVGIALAPADSDDPDGLLGKADLALYRAKASGKGELSVFEPELETAVRTRRELEADLKLAVAHGEFELHYQPLVSMKDGRVGAFEALLRWIKQPRGYVSPADFVPVAEASGLISVIGRWVLREACLEAARWPDGIRVAVNISPTQFRNADLLQDVTQALELSGLDPDRLELEITESVFFEMGSATVANLSALRALGVRIALDDFGTGYSSLSYLIRFPVDKIKIDRSFIKDMDTRHECLAIIEAILALARKLSISVTAEGVETVEQALILRERRCDDIQGFLFSPARPPLEIAGLIAEMPERFRAMVG